jgi:recA bacterial DNA recombination protein
MTTLAIQRLESLLQRRRLDRTIAMRPAGGLVPLGADAIDACLGGGWPQGEVSTIAGGRSSGRTGVLVATLAAATSRGDLVGLVDACDRFDPVTAARTGLDLDRVLWVRGAGGRRAVRDAVRALDLIVRAGGFAVAALDLGDVPPREIGSLPVTTWLRLAHANEGRETVCLLAGEVPIGRSARGRSVRVEARRCWTGAHPQSRRFAGFEVTVARCDAGGEGWPARRGAAGPLREIPA